MPKAIRSIINQCNKVDTDWCIKLNRLSKNLYIQKFFNYISWLGDGKIWYLIIFLIPFISDGGILISIEMICFGLIGTAIYKSLKNKINRPRPYKINQSIYLGGKILDQFSFPSGHTLHAVIFSLILIFYFSFVSEILLIFTLLIALSRVILGMHYPTDVFIGGLIGYIIFNLFMYYKNYENFILI